MSRSRSKKHRQEPQVTPKVVITLFTLLIIISLIGLGIFLWKTYRNSNNDGSDSKPTKQPTPTSRTLTEGETLELTIDDKKILASKKTLERDKEYSFKVTRLPSSTCKALKNVQLDYAIELRNNTTTFPITIPTTGTYTFVCIEQDVKIDFTVKN
jgi:hypothetical protein